jgi:hypothetical protein
MPEDIDLGEALGAVFGPPKQTMPGVVMYGEPQAETLPLSAVPVEGPDGQRVVEVQVQVTLRPGDEAKALDLLEKSGIIQRRYI